MGDKFYNTELFRGGAAFDLEFSNEYNTVLSDLNKKVAGFEEDKLEVKGKQLIFLGEVFECLKQLKYSAKRSMRYLNEQSVLFQIQESLHAVETDKLIGYEGYYIDPVEGKKMQYKIVSEYTVWSTSSVDKDMRKTLYYEDGILLRRDGKEILIDIEEIEDEEMEDE